MTGDEPKVIYTIIQLGSFGVLAFLIYWAATRALPQLSGMVDRLMDAFRTEQRETRAEFKAALEKIQERTDVQTTKVVQSIENLRADLRNRDERDERKPDG